MSRLSTRLAAIEKRLAPPPARSWVRVFQREGQTYEDAVAAWELENGPMPDANVCLRVIIHKPASEPGSDALP